MNRTTNKSKSRVLRADNNAAANNGKRYILIFDNHPASLRLLREVYLDSGGSTLEQYYLLIANYRVSDSWFRRRSSLVRLTLPNELAMALKPQRSSI
jgi:hypothetical protein